MKFEHLIEVNDLTQALHSPLKREQLWFGLLCRAEDARPFLPGLDACHVIERSDGLLVRELHFGNAVIRDRVHLQPMQWIRFETEASASHAGGALTISIEEPTPGALFLRFRYETTLQEEAGSEGARYVEFVRSAYHQSDLDTLAVIRTLAASGRLH